PRVWGVRPRPDMIWASPGKADRTNAQTTSNSSRIDRSLVANPQAGVASLLADAEELQAGVVDRPVHSMGVARRASCTERPHGSRSITRYDPSSNVTWSTSVAPAATRRAASASGSADEKATWSCAGGMAAYASTGADALQYSSIIMRRPASARKCMCTGGSPRLTTSMPRCSTYQAATATGSETFRATCSRGSAGMAEIMPHPSRRGLVAGPGAGVRPADVRRGVARPELPQPEFAVQWPDR